MVQRFFQCVRNVNLRCDVLRDKRYQRHFNDSASETVVANVREDISMMQKSLPSHTCDSEMYVKKIFKLFMCRFTVCSFFDFDGVCFVIW